MNIRCAMAVLVAAGLLAPQSVYGGERLDGPALARQLAATGLKGCQSYLLLQELVRVAPHRLSGSAGAAAALDITQEMMRTIGLANVRAESLLVPRWERGGTERAEVVATTTREAVPLAVCALGMSLPTPRGGITAEVVEVGSFEELQSLGSLVRQKIVFFNRPMDPGLVNTFAGYGGAVDQRVRGPIMAGRQGAVAVLVRSVTLALDDVPHTGTTAYDDSTEKIPAAAISTLDAEYLSALLRRESDARVHLTLSCRTFPDVMSANAMGEILGAEKPEEVVVVGGHLDAWDKGHGAHDDGAGCVQAIEALRLLKTLGLTPKRTIRAVMFMNEENGSRGGPAYAMDGRRVNERHIAAIEADRGGFAPRGFAVQGDSLLLARVRQWQPAFAVLEAGQLVPGSAGVDVAPLVKRGAAGFGLLVDTQRYFDYHHSDNDTIDKVYPRELELGAVAMALLSYLIAEEGL